MTISRKIITKDSQEIILNPEQDIFCGVYTTPGETFCNGVKSYAVAYGYLLPLREDGEIDTKSAEYMACKANGGRMMFNDKIRLTIQNKLLEQFNDKTVDARTSQILLSGRDSDSLTAIKMYNELKQRITKKVDVSVIARPMANLSDEELEALAKE
jgi:hypothetical protein